MRARIHLVDTDRVLWKPADEAARLVAEGRAEYAGVPGTAPADAKAQPAPTENKALRPGVENKRLRR